LTAALATWIDGMRGDAIPADDRGLNYGDGLFETLGVRAGVARFLEAHLARLSSGCARLGIRFDESAALRAEIAAAVAQAPPLAVLKIIVTRGSAMRRGYAPQGSESARRILSLWPAAGLPAAIAEGVALHRASFTLADNPALAGIKHLSRLENVMAAAEATAAGAFDALLLDGAGHLISGAMSNVFLVRDGKLRTPRLDRCGVAGVMRGVVLRECASLGIAADDGRVTLDGLLAADEVFITNARLGVVPVSRVGEHSFRMTTVARRLAAHIETLDA
jgi:4-amino-4-deoxychorismate lyase